MQVSGIVKSVSVKNQSSTGKPLKSPLYAVNIDEVWYNFGFKNPNLDKGADVTFEYSEDQYGKQGDASTVVVSTAATAVNSSPTVRTSNSTQNSIVYQSSRKDAIQLVGILLENDAVKMPTKKEDKMEAIMGLVDEITDEFAFAALDPVIAPTVAAKEVVDDE